MTGGKEEEEEEKEEEGERKQEEEAKGNLNSFETKPNAYLLLILLSLRVRDHLLIDGLQAVTDVHARVVRHGQRLHFRAITARAKHLAQAPPQKVVSPTIGTEREKWKRVKREFLWPFHCEAKSVHFETSKIHFPTSERTSEPSGARERSE